MRKSSIGLSMCAFVALFILVVGLGSGVVLAADEGAGAPSDGQGDSGSEVEIDSELETANETVRVIVWFENRGDARTDRTPPERQPSERQESARPTIAEMSGVTIERQFWLIDAMSITVDTNRVDLGEIAATEGVVSLQSDFEVEAEHTTTTSVSSSQTSTTSPDVTYGIDQINADDAWSEYGTMGAGVRVAVLDTGLEIDHDDLELRSTDPGDPTYPGGWAEFDSYGNEIEGSEPYDASDHGTHVSGTVAGGDARGEYIGVAPEADLMHAKVMDPAGYFSQIVAGMEWAIENDASVISMSMGASGYEDAWIDPIRNAESHGVVVVASIGNSGEGSSSTPGNDYDSIGIGATDSNAEIADFSSGERVERDDWDDPPSDWPDEYIVPSVAAPGESVLSADVDGDYRYASGTSMAAPHVSGAIALIQSATDERHSPDEIKEALRETAWKPDDWDERDADESLDGADTRYGHGIIDVPAAIEYLLDDDPSASFEVSDTELTDDTILASETAEVTAAVENVGDEEGEFDAEFHVTDGDGVTVQLDSMTVSLAPGESTTVTLSGVVEEAGTYQADVSGTSTPNELTVERPATFELSGGSLGNDSITEGESVEISATVENVGDREGTFTAELEVDGHVEATTDVTLGGGASDTVSFSYEPAEAGEYEITVAGDDGNDDRTHTDAGTLEVLEPAEFEVRDPTLSETEILEGESVEVTAIIENTGDAEGTFTAELEVELDDGSVEVRATQDVTLAGGESTTISFEETFESAGSYDISVSGERAGTLTVEEPDAATFETSDVTLSENTILEGESVEVEATVENVGDESGQHTAILYVDGEERATETVELEGGASTTVAFTETFETAGEYEVMVDDALAVTLTVDQPATFEVRDARLGETTIIEGESVEVSAEVENLGDRDGTFTAELVVDGEVVATRDVYVYAGSSETVTFTESFAEPGEYEIDVNDVHAGTLTVEEEPEAVFEVSGATLSDGTIEAGERVDVTATVENVGEAEGSHEVELVVDGQTVETTTVTLDVGESTTVEFTRTFDDAGEYEVAVADAQAGTLEVLEPADVEVSDAYLDAETIEEGESVTATVELTNAGDVDGEITVTVDFGDGAMVDRTVTVAAGATVTETVEHTYDDAGEYEVTADGVIAGTITVSEPSPAELAVVDATIDPETILEGETTTVEATVENVGDETDELTVELQIDDAVYDSATVTLSTGERGTVVLEATVADAGEYDVSVDGEHVATLTVQAPADLEVVDASLSDDEITVGDSVEVTGEVENTGDVAGTIFVDLEIDGEVVATTEVEVGPHEVESVTFEWTADEEGDAPVSLNGVYAGTISVDAEDSVDDGDDADDGGSGGGGGGAGGGGGGAGGGGGGTGGAAPPPADDPEEETDTETEPALATVEATDGGASILVKDTAAGETVSLDVRDAVANGSVAGGDLTLTGLTIDVGDGAGSFELDVARLTSEPRKGPDLLEYEDGYVGLGYMSVETGVDNANLDEVRFEFTVPSGALPDDASSADVTIVRYNGEAWQTLETEHAGGDTYSAVSPGFSEFAVAVPATVGAEGHEDAAAFEVLDVDVSESNVVEGEETTVTTFVENVGEETGTFTIELMVDGEVRDVWDVTIGPGASEMVEFTYAFEEAGTYEVSVNGVDEEVDVTVDAAGSSGIASSGPEDGSAGDIDDRDIPVALLTTAGLFILVLLVGGVAVAVRGGIDESTAADGAALAIGDGPFGTEATTEPVVDASTSSDRTQTAGALSYAEDGHSDDSGFQWVGDD